MKYVLDSSVAFKWVVPEVDTDRAVRLRDGYRAGVYELIAPAFFPQELAHALTRAERKKRVPVGQAIVLWNEVMTTAPAFHSEQALTARAITIASRLRVGVYDCVYVALAEREGCELVTADDKLVRNLQPHFPFVVALSTFP